jgi:hypothetical protein
MILTEQEAVEKWCPLVRAPWSFAESVAGVNDRGGDPEVVNCIGSRCMMWVWVEQEWDWVPAERADALKSEGWSEPDAMINATFNFDDGRKRQLKRPQGTRRGTCGLINRSAP